MADHAIVESSYCPLKVIAYRLNENLQNISFLGACEVTDQFNGLRIIYTQQVKNCKAVGISCGTVSIKTLCVSPVI